MSLTQGCKTLSQRSVVTKRVLLLFAIVACSQAFTSFLPAAPRQHGVSSIQASRSPFRCTKPFGLQSRLFQSSSSNNDPPKKRKRRRRKDPVTSSSKTKTTPAIKSEAVVEPKQAPKSEEEKTREPPPELKPRQEAPVMEIQDIRKVVSGVSPDEKVVKVQEELVEEEEEDDDDEYEYYYVDDEGNEVEVPAESLNSLDQLLIDARQMEEEEKELAALKKLESGQEEEEFSVPKTIRNVISTIVTVDFFVVVVLLLWFLAGIFGSYVLKDDAIQIAFNGIFQPVVQPALGILMIGSAAGAIFRDEEEE